MEAVAISALYRHRLRLGIAAAAAVLGLVLWQAGCGSGGGIPGTPQSPAPATITPIPQPTLPAQQLLPVDLVIGQTGSEPGSFNEPGGLALDAQGNLYVADIMNHRVQKFGPDGELLAQVGSDGPGDGQFHEPWGLAVDGQGNVYVADTFNHRIQKLDSGLNFILAFGIGASNLQDPEPEAFWGPRDVAVDASGNVWIADTGTGRVVKYSSSGQFLQEFGDMGSGPSQFSEPTAIEIAANGDVFVADNGNRRVQRFNSAFDFLAEYEIPGWLFLDSAAKPYMALLPDGGLIVSDPTQNKLFRLDQAGTAVATFDAEEATLGIPRGLAFDSGGFVYVAEAEPDRVRRLVLSGVASP